MTEPEPHHELRSTPEEQPPLMPRWVPVLIGAILVTFAALAVFTGLRYRDDTLTRQVTRTAEPKRQPRMAPAPPGEPEAGASLVFHGDGGENTPEADEAVEGTSRTIVTGGRDGVEAVARSWARRGMVLDVQPRDSVVYVNGVPIGEVRQFDTIDEAYDFASTGSYTIRIVSPEGRTKTFIVTADDAAEADVVTIKTEIE